MGPRAAWFALCLLVSLASAEDPLYDLMSWNFHSIHNSTGHLYIEKAWNSCKGKGVTIAFTGNMPFTDHLELEDKLNEELSHITRREGDARMTSSIAMAVGVADNNVCSRGTAPEALYAILDSDRYESALDCEWLSKYPQKKSHIYVLDYGGPDGPENLTPSPKCHTAIESVVTAGSVVIGMSGDGGEKDNCNYDNYANSPHAITVAYHSKDALIPHNAEPCAAALVSVPGGDVHRSDMLPSTAAAPSMCSMTAGSPFAAASAAGVVALLLEAGQFALSPRDIAHILVRSAYHPSHLPWLVNGGGRKHHPILGMGLVNVDAALARAKRWIPVSEAQVMTQERKSTVRLPDLSDATVDFTFPPSQYVVERMSLAVRLKHSSSADLRISIISPFGTESVLAEARAKGVNSSTLFARSLFMTNVPLDPLSSASQYSGTDLRVSVHYYTLAAGSRCCIPSDCILTLPRTNKDVDTKRVLVVPYTKECDAGTYVFNAVFTRTYAQPDIVILQQPQSLVPFDKGSISAVSGKARVYSVNYHTFSSFVDLINAYDTLTIVPGVEKYSVDMTDWTFTTTRHWDESLEGKWQLRIQDRLIGGDGALQWSSLSAFVHIPSPHVPSPSPSPSPIPTSAPSPTPSPTPTPSPSPFPKPTPTRPPHPTPTPVPTPAISRVCCLYLSESDYVSRMCLSQDTDCGDHASWVFLNQYFVTEDTCKSYCPHAHPSGSLRCCWMRKDNDPSEKLCRSSVGDCVASAGYSIVAQFPTVYVEECNFFCS